MKKFNIAALTAACIMTTTSLFAIERDANMIDTAWLDMNFFDDYDYIGLHVTGENLVKNGNDKWAILAGFKVGAFDPDYGSSFNSLGIELGVKYYITPLTAIACLGGYEWNDADIDFNTGTVTTRLKQRFTDPGATVSPYIKLEAAVDFIDMDDSDNILIGSALAGCDFRMSDTMAIVFEGGISASDNLDDGPDTDDGMILRVGMQYDWN